MATSTAGYLSTAPYQEVPSQELIQTKDTDESVNRKPIKPWKRPSIINHAEKWTPYIRYTHKINEYIDDKENIDIYQYFAYLWNKSDDKSASFKFHRCKLCHEVLLCAIAQIVGVVIILKEIITEGIDNDHPCHLDNDNVEMKFLAWTLSTIAGYYSMRVFMYEKGMYAGGIQQCCSGNGCADALETILILSMPPGWISVFWMQFGLWVNRIVSIGAVIGSFIVIFVSDNAFDMVLNSVALFFLMELDDMLMTAAYYREMKKLFKYWPQDETEETIADTIIRDWRELISQLKEDPEWMSPQDEDDWNSDKCFIRLSVPLRETLGDQSICCRTAHGVNICCYGCYMCLSVLFLAACILVPLYIGICY